MRKKFLFSNSNMEYSDYLKTIKDAYEDHSFVFASKECVSLGLLALAKEDDEEKRKKIMSFSFAVDREYNYPGGNNSSHKFAYIFNAANMISNYSSYVMNLNNNELSLLAFFSFIVDDMHMQKHLEFFANKELLNSVIEKTPDRNFQLDILKVIEDKYFEFDIDYNNKEEFNKFKQESINFVKNNSTEEFLDQIEKYNNRAEELMNNTSIYF